MRLGAIHVSCLVLLLAAGCTTPAVELKSPHPYGQDTGALQYSWHQLRFKWAWPEGRAPDWSLDPLVADLVLSDLIASHQESLPLWRFHRRAGRGPAGHQFSFIFYSSSGTARQIQDSAADHATTRRLMEQGLLEKVYLTTPEDPGELSATSDPNWPASVQSTWPMFIMGVSQTWLGLVELHAGNTAAPGEDLEDALERYATVNAKVNELWSEYAQHAFFHHLSGVFGYQPMTVRKRMRF